MASQGIVVVRLHRHMTDTSRTTPEGYPVVERDPGELSLLDIGNVLLRNIRVIIVMPVVLASIVVLASLLLGGRTYQALATVLPQISQQPLSRYSGLASQFGINLPGGGSSGESLSFYSDLLRSRTLLEATVLTPYSVVNNKGAKSTGTLVDLFGSDGKTAEERTHAAVEELRGSMDVRIQDDAGVLELETRASSPDLATQINRRMLSLLSEYNLERRQSQAKAERSFTEARLAEASKALTDAERSLQQFLEKNRTYQSSPQLMFEAARLQRRVELQQQLQSSLAQAYEQARIDEVRNTPVVTIVDPPEGSAQPADSPLPLRVFAALSLGLIMAIGVALIREYAERTRFANPEEYAQFHQLRSTAFRRMIRGSRPMDG